MSASLAPLMPVVCCYVNPGTSNPTRFYNNPSSILNGNPYEFSITLTIIPITTSNDPINLTAQFDGTFIAPGQWLVQPTGFSYLVVSVDQIIDNLNMTITVRDVDLFNCLSSNNIGFNYPFEDTGNISVIISLSEDGSPILTYIQGLIAAGITTNAYWDTDAFGRFKYTNYYQEYYVNLKQNIYYTGYNIDQVVYIGLTGGNYMYLPVDSADPIQCDKAFGIVSSVNQPEDGNIYVRPFGKVIANIPYTLPGNIGDVLYYDSNNPPSYCTNIKPTSGIPIRKYIKLDTNSASVLYGPDTGGGGSTGTAASLLDDAYHQNTINVPIVVPSTQLVSSTIVITKPCGIWATGTFEFNNTDSVRHTVAMWIGIDGKYSQHLQTDIQPPINNIGGFVTTSVQFRVYCSSAGTKTLTMYASSDTNNGKVRCTHFDIFGLGDL